MQYLVLPQRCLETVLGRNKNGLLRQKDLVLEPPLPNQVIPSERLDLKEPGFLTYKNWD